MNHALKTDNKPTSWVLKKALGNVVVRVVVKPVINTHVARLYNTSDCF